MLATWGGLTFVGDDSAATYTLEKVIGWWGGVEMRHESTPRPNADGDFDSPAYLGGRVITLRGLILADDDPAAFEAALAALDEAGADGSKSEFTLEQAAATYSVQARRHGSLDFDPIVWGRRGRYQLQLWAPDPAKELVP